MTSASKFRFRDAAILLLLYGVTMTPLTIAAFLFAAVFFAPLA